MGRRLVPSSIQYMICMLEKWDLWFVINTFRKNNPMPWNINLTNLACLTSVLPGDTSDSWNLVCYLCFMCVFGTLPCLFLAVL